MKFSIFQPTRHVRAHPPDTDKTNVHLRDLAAKNGLCFFSSPTVVIGPWPGQMIVSSGSARIFSRLFRTASWYDTFPPPIEPAKSESPTIAIGCARPVTTYVIPPGNDPRSVACRFASCQAE